MSISARSKNGLYFILPLLSFVLLLCVSGCSMGPKTFKGNRFDYNVMLQRSKSEEIVLNLVRARYWEPPFFLQVGSISSSFGYSFNMGASAALTNNLRNSAPGIDTYSPSLGTRISESPTVTYAPLQGEEAIRRLQTEMSLEHFLILTRTGFDINSLMWTTVARIGDLNNFDPSRPLTDSMRENYVKFLDLARILRDLQAKGNLEFIRVGENKNGDNEGLRMQLRFLDRSRAEKFEGLLGINPRRTVLPDKSVVIRIELTTVRDLTALRGGATECPKVPVRLKSFFQMLYDFSGFVEVAQRDLKKKIARPFSPPAGNLASRSGLHSGLIRIKTAQTPPSSAYVKIAYRGRYFYINDEDYNSKAYLMLLESVFSLLSGDIKSVKPLITIPVGGR